MTRTPAAKALDLSSLARFDDAAVAHIYKRRLARVLTLRAGGADFDKIMAASGLVRTAVEVLTERGIDYRPLAEETRRAAHQTRLTGDAALTR